MPGEQSATDGRGPADERRPRAPVPETLVVSDLHLGSNSGSDLIRSPGVAQDALIGALDGVERLVLAGDLLELRHAPPRVILERAAPVLRRIGAALGDGAEVLVLPGNHDHRLVDPWLARRRLRDEPLSLASTLDPGTASDVAAAVAELLAPARVRIAYPAAWLVAPRSDGSGGVLVHHGHYVDALWRMPTFERLAAGLTARTHGVGESDLRSPGDFERVLAPGYGWMDALADHAVGAGAAASQRATSGVWDRLNDRSSWSGRVLRSGVPRVVSALERLGIGSFESRLTPETLRLSGLRGMSRVADRLRVRPDHLIVGHTHRAGPLPGDAAWEWTLQRGGGRLWNSGSWVHAGTAPVPVEDGPGSPYWPGRAVRIGPDGVPRLLELLADVADPRA